MSAKLIRKEPKLQHYPVEKVELTLTPEEAIVLVDLCHNTGGSPKGPRGYVDKIAQKLYSINTPILAIKKDENYKSIFYTDSLKLETAMKEMERIKKAAETW